MLQFFMEKSNDLTDFVLVSHHREEEKEPRREYRGLYTIDEPVIVNHPEYLLCISLDDVISYTIELGNPHASTNLFDFTMDLKCWYQEYFIGRRK